MDIPWFPRGVWEPDVDLCSICIVQFTILQFAIRSFIPYPPTDNIMASSVSGVVPPDLRESTVMTVWPSIGIFATGRLVGRFCENRLGRGFFTLGKLGAIASIPWSLVLYCWLRMPYVSRRYVLTNRRVIIRRGLRPVDKKWIDLDEFTAVEVEVLPGQEWLHAGEVVFRRGGSEILRLSGVLRPEVFAQVCRSTQQAQLSVRRVLQEQLAAAE
jgi:hypothetical protein